MKQLVTNIAAGLLTFSFAVSTSAAPTKTESRKAMAQKEAAKQDHETRGKDAWSLHRPHFVFSERRAVNEKVQCQALDS